MKSMKFILKNTSLNYGRKGKLSGVPRLLDFQVETPSVMLYTKGASVPHLTHEVYNMVVKEPQIMQLPLLTICQMKPGVEAQGKGITNFSGLGNNLTMMVLQDPTVEIPQGKFETNKMPLWTRNGKFHLDSQNYMDFVECYKPDMYAVLYDGSTSDTSSKKRTSKSVERSIDMFKECLQRHNASDYLRTNSAIFGVIVGGYSIENRNKSLEVLLSHEKELDGFMLEGFDTNGPSFENKSFESLKNVVENMSKCLPNDKIRVIQGCWNPVTLLDLIMAGWDLFDATLPYQCTERGCGLTFSFNVNLAKKQNNCSYEIDLKDIRYKEDFLPVLADCECLCCKKYSRAYINHLLNTRELLANLLLMIHNLHHYLEFFKCIREYASTENILKMRKLISDQMINTSNHEI